MRFPQEVSFYFILESFFENPQVFYKPSFGGISVYFNGKLVLSIHEDKKTTWKNVDYGFPIWDGLLIPTEKVNHESLIQEIPDLIVHPFLKKWLYLRQEQEIFEENVEKILKLIKKQDPRIGVFPKIKKGS